MEQTADGRSPFRPRQLDDLTLAPTKDDPRPTFFWSAVSPRHAGDLKKTEPYPRLLWHRESGQEITVHSLSEHQKKLADYQEIAPALVAVDPMAAIQAELDALSPEDRALVIEGQRQDRINALRAKMAKLPDASLETLLTDAKEKATDKGKRKSA
jgi:hypothetical protein